MNEHNYELNLHQLFSFFLSLDVVGEVEFVVPHSATAYTTDGQIAVEIKKTKPFPSNDNTFKVNLRLCKQILSACFDQFQVFFLFMRARFTQAITLADCFCANLEWQRAVGKQAGKFQIQLSRQSSVGVERQVCGDH